MDEVKLNEIDGNPVECGDGVSAKFTEGYLDIDATQLMIPLSITFDSLDKIIEVYEKVKTQLAFDKMVNNAQLPDKEEDNDT